ncbi:PC4 and SFRS1-interacting protein-like [Hydractinia symbiolongicarpus]|uniref:PC4 and SFRS1-interacting protein-like n=1 Tax=Hydractinia symbiolongicarpus TaxID=13093 RepID=UPI00254D29C1|nr:PC4 and SFRS1-interacting protein-like [Hydractinia symbiolongicarpus]
MESTRLDTFQDITNFDNGERKVKKETVETESGKSIKKQKENQTKKMSDEENIHCNNFEVESTYYNIDKGANSFIDKTSVLKNLTKNGDNASENDGDSNSFENGEDKELSENNKESNSFENDEGNKLSVNDEDNELASLVSSGSSNENMSHHKRSSPSQRNDSNDDDVDDEFGIAMFESNEKLQNSMKSDLNNQEKVDSPISEKALRRREKRSSWIQCDRPECQKWRRIDYVDDLRNVSDGKWICCMNEDSQHNDCDLSQESFPDIGSEDESIYTTFKPGTLVLGKMPGYPWWPGIIEDDPDFDSYFYLEHRKEKTVVSYHVTFFGKDVSRAWLNEVAVTNFDGHETLKDLGTMSSGGKRYARQVTAALGDAKKAMEYSSEKRLRRYGFLKRYKGNDRPKETCTVDNETKVKKNRFNNGVKKEKKHKQSEEVIKQSPTTVVKNVGDKAGGSTKTKVYNGKQTARKLNKTKVSKDDSLRDKKEKKRKSKDYDSRNLVTSDKNGTNSEFARPTEEENSDAFDFPSDDPIPVGGLICGNDNEKQVNSVKTKLDKEVPSNELTDLETHTKNMVEKYISTEELDRIVLSKDDVQRERKNKLETKGSKKVENKSEQKTKMKQPRKDGSGEQTKSGSVPHGGVKKKKKNVEQPKKSKTSPKSSTVKCVDTCATFEMDTQQDCIDDVTNSEKLSLDQSDDSVKKTSEVPNKNSEKEKLKEKPVKEKSSDKKIKKKKSLDNKELKESFIDKKKFTPKKESEVDQTELSSQKKKKKIPKLVKAKLPSVPVEEILKHDSSQAEKPPPKLKKSSFKAPVKSDACEKVAPSFSARKKKSIGGKRPITRSEDEIEISTEPPVKKMMTEEVSLTDSATEGDLFALMSDEEKCIKKETMLHDSPEF